MPCRGVVGDGLEAAVPGEKCGRRPLTEARQPRETVGIVTNEEGDYWITEMFMTPRPATVSSLRPRQP